jgi:hypothetical protein
MIPQGESGSSSPTISKRGRKVVKVEKATQKFGFVFYELLYGPIVFVHAVYRQLIILFLMFALGAAIFL